MSRRRATPTPRPRADGRGFYVYAYPRGARRQFNFPDKASAVGFLERLERDGADAAAGAYRAARRLGHRDDVVTLAELARDYANSRPKPATAKAYLGQARYLDEFEPTASLAVGALTVDDLADYLAFLRARPNGRGGTLAPGTVRMAWVLARNVLDRAVRAGLVRINAAAMVEDQPRAGRRGTENLAARAISEAEFRAIADRLDEADRPLFEVLWASGLRIGEALALEWQHVRSTSSPDLVELFVEWSLTLEVGVTGKGTGWAVGPTKSGRARRVGVAASALDGLERGGHRERLFTRPRWHYSEAWASARDAAHAAGEAPESVRVHDLRHSRVTILLERGAQPKLVSEAMGHASVAFTLDRYAHARPSDVLGLGLL